MAVSPRVSIIMPLYNDEPFVAAALDSCLAQTVSDIEILAVDDASTDRTVAIVEEYARRDPRVRLIRQPTNLSAFQARRAGVAAANAPYLLFLDGDDELAPTAAESALVKAEATDADVVGFGVEIIVFDGRVPRKFEAALQPRHNSLSTPDIVPQLFPSGEEANGHIWRYLFASSLLRAAYDGVPFDLAFYRANDIPITLLALAHATKYVSIQDRLYKYYFRRGTSGHAIDDIERFRFLLSGVAPITAISERMQEVARKSAEGQRIVESYESARLHIIGNVLRNCIRYTSGDLQKECLALLVETVGDLDVIRAGAGFVREALTALSSHATEPSHPEAAPRSVLLTTAHLATGGLQGVLLEQAAQLVASGHRVTIAVMRDAGREVRLPSGVNLIQLTGDSILARIDHWVAVCDENDVDVIIDHHILYNENWPWFALAALAVGVPTIGWVHNFALRPLFDRSERASFLAAHLDVLLRVVALSPTDVAFWKLRGFERVAYLPNPASPLALVALGMDKERRHRSGRINLAWWGRLDPSTKQVQHLVQVAQHLRSRGVDFALKIIGPDSPGLTADQVRTDAVARGVDDAIELTGERDTAGLLSELDDAHLLVMTSAIEGSPLTIIEAQALGLPIVMYDLPWLVTARGNGGLVSTPPDDPGALADAILQIAHAPDRYDAMSEAAREYASSVAAIDHGALLEQLLAGTLPPEFSPEPSREDAELLVEWLLRFSERNIRSSRRGPQGGDEYKKMKRERDLAQSKLRQITDGASFKVGRALTFLPRKLRGTDPIPKRLKATILPVVRKVRERLPVNARRKSSVRPPLPQRAPHGSARPQRSPSPDVSVVIPVFNSAPWLDDCISSVLAQTAVSVEVICVNDGSTDGSQTILRRWAELDPRVTVLDQTNHGQSVSRNRGLDAAIGRYLVYLDSDDYWPTDSLSKLVSRADDDNLDVLLFDCVTFREGDVDEKTWRWYSRYYQRSKDYPEVRPGSDLMADMRSNRDYRPHIGLYLARTDFVRLLDLRFIPNIVHQDNPYTFRLLLGAERAAHVRIDAYARRIRPGSTITTLTADRSARGYFLSYLEMTRQLSRHVGDASSSEALQDIVDYVYRGASKQFALLSDESAEQIRALDPSPDAQATFASLVDSRDRAD